MKKVQSGFTLIELMIVVAIIGILASVAIPAYDTYIKRSKFVEVIMATSPARAAVEIGIQGGRATKSTAVLTLAEFNPASNGVPANISNGATSIVNTLTTANGLITVTGGDPVDGKTYVLTPTLNATFTSVASWGESGTCIDAGVC